MAAPLDLNNIQGDILPSLPKKTETFFFFKIASVNDFRSHLTQLIPQLTTGTQVQSDRAKIVEHKRNGYPGLVKIQGVNVSFSKEGLVKLGINASELGDAAFDTGMLADAFNLGDRGATVDGSAPPAWEAAFLKQDIDGVFLAAGDCRSSVAEVVDAVKAIFKVGADGASVEEALTLVGDTRPDEEDGHEHFGFEDGISNPAVTDVDTALPGQEVVKQGTILIGRDGDKIANRPAWAIDGTVLAFRKLAQLVPEFDTFLTEKALPINDPSPPADHGKELLGARLVGRWKSGAPIELTPLVDDKALADDKTRNNNFDFVGDEGAKCPFAAHIRKTNPRRDIIDATGGNEDNLKDHLMLRRGIPYGPEVTDAEKQNKKTSEDRGLLFVSYQSNIVNGFKFVQESWSNNKGFIFGKTPAGSNIPTTEFPGFDPIIGQNSDDSSRSVFGTDPASNTASLDLGAFEWVVSHGGAYFFTPSIPALKANFAATAAA